MMTGTRRVLSSLRALAGRREVLLMILLAGLAGGVWGFLELAEAVSEGETATVDERILLAFRTAGNPDDPLGSHAVESAVRDVTALGSLSVLAFLTLAVAAYFALDHRPRTSLYVILAVVSGAALTFALKFLFDRPRPSLLAPELLPGDPSFPSGHAAVSAVVYLTLGLLLTQVAPRRRLKVYVVALAAALTFAVGVSRVYLGMHWPTDVLAGWTLGGAWALLCWQVERRLQRRGVVEAAPAPEEA